MTIKEAIKEIRWVKERGFVADKGILGTDRIIEACEIAIEALQNCPSEDSLCYGCHDNCLECESLAILSV